MTRYISYLVITSSINLFNFYHFKANNLLKKYILFTLLFPHNLMKHILRSFGINSTIRPKAATDTYIRIDNIIFFLKFNFPIDSTLNCRPFRKQCYTIFLIYLFYRQHLLYYQERTDHMFFC